MSRENVATATYAAYIDVPSYYRYCPDTCTPKVLHDYCTWSPDTWGKANFKGPCARHDMWIDAIRVKRVELTEKKRQRRGADATFRDHLKVNCAYAYSGGASLTGCNAAAATYYTVVGAKTSIWDGK